MRRITYEIQGVKGLMGSEVLNTSISKWSYLIYCFVLFGRVDEDRLRECSPVLARLFLQSIFISVDIRIREGHLFCDCLCDSGPLYNGQVIVLRLFYRRFQVPRVLRQFGSLALRILTVSSFHTWLTRVHWKMAAYSLSSELTREVNRRFLANECGDVLLEFLSVKWI